LDLGPASQTPLALDAERTAWLTTLYETNARMVFMTCRRLLQDAEEAADATHEVFLRAVASLHVAPDGDDARAWLTTVARNYCLDTLRRRRRLRSALTTLGAGATQLESENVVVDRQLAQAVLNQLAVRERQALWDSHVEQRSVGEIASRLGLSYLATAQLLSRARRRAALVAAELAAILLLLRSGLRRTRTTIQNLAAHPVAALLIIPVVVTALISTGSGIQSRPAAAAAVARAYRQAAAPSRPGPPPTSPRVGALSSGQSGAAGSIIHSAPQAVLSVTLQRTVAPVPVTVHASTPSPVATPVRGHHNRGRHKGPDHESVGDRKHDALTG
jgi:RNA polymerase sigma-70 factor (ECF subfamily)